MKSKVIYPFFIAIAVLVGYYLHSMISKREIPSVQPRVNMMQSGKLENLFYLMNTRYYKDLNTDSIREAIIPKILSSLDPHTAYIPAERMKIVKEDMQGEFSGIGIQFIKYEDTIMVVKTIEGGPSEKAGLLAGDRLVLVDEDSIACKEMPTDSIVKMLKAEAGTVVTVGVKRNKVDSLLSFKIERGPVRVSSIDIAYMLNPNTAYIKVNQFGGQTYNEFVEALANMQKQGAEQYIIDLRGNQGGLLGVCIAMVNEFLEKGQLIVYTEGKHQPRLDRRANGQGRFKDVPIVVLIDTYSASASEIFAGAIQDHDRGVIVGRRSFGKGLVQEQIEFSDASAVRLTISEYFTPAGRNIQKPFKNGDKEAYRNDINNRYERGEFTQADSIHFTDSLKVRTDEGRIVYGGGGIMPDVFVPLDTMAYTSYYEKLQSKMIVANFAFYFADKYREKLQALPDIESMEVFIKQKRYMDAFVRYAIKKGVKKDDKEYKISEKMLKNQLMALIVRNIIDNEGFYPIYHREDDILKKALTSFPTK